MRKGVKQTAFEGDVKRAVAGAARRGVMLAFEDFYYPPIPEAKVKVGSRWTRFYITEGEWRVHLEVSVEDVPFLDYDDLTRFFRSVCRHEVAHYTVCPYDVATSTLLVSRAARAVEPRHAPFVVNFFTDLIVDTYLFERYPEEALWTERVIVDHVHRKFGGGSKVWKLFVRSYEKVWGKRILTGVKVEVPRDVEEAATRISRVLKRGGVMDEKAWPGKVEKLAKILKPFLEEEMGENPPKGVRGTLVKAPDGGRVFLPDDVAHTMRGNPVDAPMRVRGRRMEEGEKAARRFAEEGGRLEEFLEASRIAGLSSSRRKALRAWYRGKANLKVDVRVRSRRRGGLPVYPDVWRLEDPIDELDVPLSLQAFPRLIPNVTTKKWVRFSGEGGEGERSPPDMLIVLDSSGSMGGVAEGTPFDLALTAAFAALKFAVSRCCKVAAVNFSDRTLTCEWTRSRVQVEDVLLRYQGGGTVLPVNEISSIVRRNSCEVLVLVITDAEIANWGEAVKELEKLIVAGHHVAMFFIGGGMGGRKEERYRRFLSAGGRIYPIPNVKNLPEIVIGEVGKHYHQGW